MEPNGPSSLVPRPDPTVLTTAALQREIAALKELIEMRLNALNELHEQHCVTIDIKFQNVDLRFRERDDRQDRSDRDARVAIDAAFSAQKEAAAKQERSTAETLAKQADLFATSTDALRSSLGEVKDRLTRIEGTALGRATEQVTQGTTTRDNSNILFGVLGVGGMIAAIFVAIFR